MNAKNRSLIQIHLAVLLFGLAGLFGKLLSLPALIIVLGRVVFSSLFLLFIILYLRQDIRLKSSKDYLYLLAMGVILASHWGTFFMSIQVSTVAIGLLTFSTFPVFVTFLEPFFFREKINPRDIGAAIIAMVGAVMVVPSLQWENNTTQGVLWGVISGCTYAILSLLNRKYVQKYASSVIAFYEQFFAGVLLSPYLFWYQSGFQPREIWLLVLLGIVFTGISHTLFISGLKNVKAQTAGIISCLEPVYGIICAIFLIREIPAWREVIGGIIILSTVLYVTAKSK